MQKSHSQSRKSSTVKKSRPAASGGQPAIRGPVAAPKLSSWEGMPVGQHRFIEITQGVSLRTLERETGISKSALATYSTGTLPKSDARRAIEQALGLPWHAWDRLDYPGLFCITGTELGPWDETAYETYGEITGRKHTRASRLLFDDPRSDDDLATFAEVTSVDVHLWREARAIPNLETRHRLAGVLGIDLTDWLVTKGENADKSEGWKLHASPFSSWRRRSGKFDYLDAGYPPTEAEESALWAAVLAELQNVPKADLVAMGFARGNRGGIRSKSVAAARDWGGSLHNRYFPMDANLSAHEGLELTQLTFRAHTGEDYVAVLAKRLLGYGARILGQAFADLVTPDDSTDIELWGH